jgi:phage protein D
VLAEDRLQDLRMTRRTRTFQDVTDAAAFEQIASEHGLNPVVDMPGPTYKVLAQVNQSDLAFLRERARANEGEIWLDDRTLHIERRSARGKQSLTLTYGNQLQEFRVLADLAGQRTAVSANGWDVASKTTLTYEAGESTLNGELGGMQSGGSILTAAFGPRKESLVHGVPLNSQEAQARAESFYRQGARRFITGHGTAQTDTKLRAGNQVELSGIGSLFNGKYYLSEVRHLFDTGLGLRTEIWVERPGLGQP